ncbi:hypothetical protein IWZ01DRAFT_343958 [Phyllosticta capitalensis]
MTTGYGSIEMVSAVGCGGGEKLDALAPRDKGVEKREQTPTISRTEPQWSPSPPERSTIPLETSSHPLVMSRAALLQRRGTVPVSARRVHTIGTSSEWEKTDERVSSLRRSSGGLPTWLPRTAQHLRRMCTPTYSVPRGGVGRGESRGQAQLASKKHQQKKKKKKTGWCSNAPCNRVLGIGRLATLIFILVWANLETSPLS